MTEQAEQKTGRGGKRVGSGRPPTDKKRKNISIMLSEECIEYLHSLGQEHPGEKGIRYSRYIEDLLWQDKARREATAKIGIS